MTDPKPTPTHVIVGIDVGMTCTGVAICSYSKKAVKGPLVIQKWPGTNQFENKIPTQVTYRAATAAHVHSVGFECPKQENIGPGMRLIDMFKFHLDDALLGQRYTNVPGRTPDTLDDVKYWYRTFLTALYNYIAGELRDVWNVDTTLTRVEYNFSLPTSWKDNERLIRRYREIIHDSGFGNDVRMELTEGEAAAVFTAKHYGQELTEGDVFIVCDSGGGTTDMCVLQVKGRSGEAVQLRNLEKPRVLPVGSVSIDELFETKIKGRVAELRRTHPELSENLAHHITRGVFQRTKKSFGTPRSLPIWRFSVSNKYPEKIEVSENDIQAMFDQQIKKIFEFIDTEVDSLKRRGAEVQLPCLVLAGGLSSSKYVQDEMMRHYEKNIRVLFAGKPDDLPLAVCKGLVINRLQHLSNEISVVPIPSAGASYGILHWGRGTDKVDTCHKSSIDGKKYTPNRIQWLHIGGKYPQHGEIIKQRYSRLLTHKDQAHRWRFAVVRSTLPLKRLPKGLTSNDRDATIFCVVTADLTAGSEDPGEAKVRRLKWRAGLQADYEISAIIKPGELRFQAKFAGQTESEGHELEVKWLDDSPSGAAEWDSELDGGLLKPTNNRLGHIDDAIISRIHPIIEYKDLTPENRLKIWKQFFAKLTQDRINYTVDDYLESFVESGPKILDLKWSGSEIRNSFQAAVALAEYDAKSAVPPKENIILRKSHVEGVADMSAVFKQYMKEFKGGAEKRAFIEGARMDDGIRRLKSQLDKARKAVRENRGQ